MRINGEATHTHDTRVQTCREQHFSTVREAIPPRLPFRDQTVQEPKAALLTFRDHGG